MATEEESKFQERIVALHGEDCKKNFLKIMRQSGDRCDPNEVLENAIAMTHPDQVHVNGQKMGLLRFNSQ